MVMMPENTTGRINKYLQFKNVTTPKHAASPQVTPGIFAKQSLG
jgi:hypothetical protein